MIRQPPTRQKTPKNGLLIGLLLVRRCCGSWCRWLRSGRRCRGSWFGCFGFAFDLWRVASGCCRRIGGGRGSRRQIADRRRSRRNRGFCGSGGEHFAGVDGFQLLRLEHCEQNRKAEEESRQPSRAFLKHIAGVSTGDRVHHSTTESGTEAFLLRTLHQDDENK